MILSEEKRAEFEEAAKPLIKWLNDNCHPHVTVVTTTTTSELSEGVASIVTHEYVKD